MANKLAVLSRPSPDASLPRNAFDRESMRVYHYSLGQLIPAWFEVLTAGSHAKINRKIFQRTSDLNTAAFPMIDTHIQYYFVPFRQLWSLWDDFKLGIKDVNSTSLVNISDTTTDGNLTLPNRVPYTSLADLETALINSQSNGEVDIFGFPAQDSARKLLNMLGYGFPFYGANQLEVNLWPILAYHKIYYDHFRNSSYENNLARLYNLDYLWSRNRDMKVPANELKTTRDGLLSLHYVNYRDDYFTNIYPSLNYVQLTAVSVGPNYGPGNLQPNPIGVPSNIVNGNVGTVPVNISGSTGTDRTRWSVWDGSSLTSNSNVKTLNTGDLYQEGNPNVTIVHSHDISGQFNLNASQVLNVQAIRAAFAFDKLLRSSAYAPQHVKDQYEARFGIKFNVNPDESIYVGSYKNDIQIGEVTSTANTLDSGGDALGAIGGKGVGFSDWQKTIDFNANEDGILMAIQYSTIRSCYRSIGVDSYLTKHLPEDYFQPEFQNLGLEPVYGSEFNQSLGQSTILGYRPRNQRYKLGIDKSYGLFADVSQDLSMFINHTDVGRVVPVGASGVNYSWFKVKPSDLNGVLTAEYDGTWSTDQFYGQTIFGCTVNQNMSVHGQPSL